MSLGLSSLSYNSKSINEVIAIAKIDRKSYYKYKKIIREEMNESMGAHNGEKAGS